MDTDDQLASTAVSRLWGKLTLRERRQRLAERKRQATYERAKVSVARESASVMGAIPPGEPRLERQLNAGDHVVLDLRNRSLVGGTTTRLNPGRGLVNSGLGIAIYSAIVIWFVGGLPGLLIALAGAVVAAAAAVFVFRKRARFEAHGRLLTGEVTSVDEGYGWVSVPYPGGMVRQYRLQISYRFLTPTGEERAGTWYSKPDTSPMVVPVPAPGDQLAILYADGLKERVM